MKIYDKYKSSGIDWIGNIREHWERKNLKYIANVVLGKMLTTEKKYGYLSKPYLRAANINWLKVNVSDIKEMWFSPNEIEKLKVKTNDLLVSEGGEVGRTCIWQDEIKECFIQNSVHKITFFDGFNAKYFLYQFYYLGNVGFFESIVNRISIGHLTGEKLKDVCLITPTFDEQTAIADYLDEKTAQIDSLINNKLRLIELIKEERTAIINQAVARGINRNAKLKPSGIAWIGNIPEHWEVKKLRYVANKVLTGSTPPSSREEYYEAEVNWFTPSDFSDTLLLTNSKRKISKLAIKEDVVKMFPANSILLVGIGATLGKVGYIEEPASSNQQINAITMSSLIETKFYSYLFNINQSNISALANAATLAILNQAQTKDIPLVEPPLEEQKQIVEFIETATSKIDATIATIKKEIDFLGEYRTGLISEVVTGKIKVF